MKAKNTTMRERLTQKFKPEAGQLLKDVALMGSSRYFALLLGSVRGLILPVLLGPTSYGIWKSLSIIADFSRLPQCGTSSAMFRQLPLLMGRNADQEMEETVETAFTVNWANAVLVGLGVFGFSFVVEDESLVAPLRLYAALIFLNEIFMFMKIYFSSTKEFAFLSQINSISAVASFAIVLGMTLAYGLTGLLIGSAAELFMVVLLFMRRFKHKIRFRVNLTLLRDMVKVGAPLMFSALMMQLLTSVDKLVILKYLGKTAVGYYSLGLTILTMASQGLYAITTVVSPRLIEVYGKNENIHDIYSYTSKTFFTMACLSPVLFVLLYFSGEVLYGEFFPKYLEGYASFQILLLATYFIVTSNVLTSFFVAIQKQHVVVVMQGGMILLAFVGNYVAIKLFGTLAAVASATVLVMLLYSVLVICFAMSHYYKGRLSSYLLFFVEMFAPLLYSLLLVYLLEFALGGLAHIDNHYLKSAGGYTLFMMAYLPVLYWGYKKIARPAEVVGAD